jgi:hypothetical protein
LLYKIHTVYDAAAEKPQGLIVVRPGTQDIDLEFADSMCSTASSKLFGTSGL